MRDCNYYRYTESMIIYSTTNKPDSNLVLGLFNAAGIGKPNWTTERLQRSINNSTLVVTAWENEKLVGYLSVVSDLAWVGYVSQLAVDPSLQKNGIGKELIQLTEKTLGDEVTLVLHSSDQATTFYEKLGFDLYSNVFRKKRIK